MQKNLKSAILLLSSLLIVNCEKKSSEPITADNTVKVMEENTNINGLWVLKSTTDKNLNLKSGTSLKIEDQYYNLNALCNNVSGSITIDADKITFKGGVSTKKACMDDYENDLVKLINAVQSFKSTDSELSLTTKEGVTLVFNKQILANYLTEKEWSVVTSKNGGLSFGDDNPAFTMTFTKDGKVSGFCGCNTFTGNYKLDGDQITIDKVVTTKMACLGDAAKDEENFLSNLNKSVFKVEDTPQQLSFRFKDGAVNFVLQ
jgi:heat shock protein HslJ